MLRCALLALAAVSAATARGQNTAPYLGQKPPGLTPEVFAPGIISRADEHEFGSVFSADGKALFYGVDVDGKSEIRHLRLGDDGVWTAPRKLLVHDRYSYNDPFLSPDERRLFFISNRPLNGRGAAKDIDIWYIERTGEGWSEPKNAGAPVNSSANEYYISFTRRGTLYFASNRHAEKDRDFDFDLYAAKGAGEGFAAPERLAGAVNTRGYEADVFVAYDESYVVFSAARREGLGRGDLYISFREKNGAWSQAKNLGPAINTAQHELCPFLTRDGKYFFYTSDQDIYWVRAEILRRAPNAPRSDGSPGFGGTPR